MRHAHLETPVDHAGVVATALRPDHTADMETSVCGDHLLTEVDRPTTRSLQSTVDDYLVNLAVADRVNRIVTDTEHPTTDTADHS